LSPELVPHAMAVFSGSFCSQAFFDGTCHGVESPCWFCGCEGFADFNHQAWGCPFWAAGQPPTPQDLVQFNLGWPMTTNTQYNFQVVHHLIAVRQALAERRHALD